MFKETFEGQTFFCLRCEADEQHIDSDEEHDCGIESRSYYTAPLIQPKNWNIIDAFKSRSFFWLYFILLSSLSGAIAGGLWYLYDKLIIKY